MNFPQARHLIRQSLATSIANNQPIIGVAVGSGSSAKQAVAGGADLLLVLNAGRFRMLGVGSIAALMPYANSNKMVMEFGSREILPRVKDTPVIFGACATDPTVNIDRLIEQIIEVGFTGVNNFPTVGLIDGILRRSLEESGFGFEREVEFMAKARLKNLFTIAFVFNPEQAALMAAADVDVICAHLGFTAGGKVSVKQNMSIEEGVQFVTEIFASADKINPNTFKMIYGGPVNEPKQADFFYHNTNAIGYIGGSSFERIPTEGTIEEITGQFKNMTKLKEENEFLRKELLKKGAFDEIVGQSRIMQQLYDVVSKVADKNINVLVYGPSGTGKELVVRAIHYHSSRTNQPFIKVNCAAIPENLLESELFGHEKGAFTGATHQRLGMFELADKGTLFLDEIGEMNIATQAKLLRAIQEQEFQRVGGTRLIKVDVRIVCATNIDLRQAVSQGKFREDLFYRLNVISIQTPTLQSHQEDIPLLVNYFLGKINKKFNKNIRKLTPAALEALLHYDWPGNVRELQHTLESAAVLSDDDVIGLIDLPAAFQIGLSNVVEDKVSSGIIKITRNTVASMEKQLIIEALDEFFWHRVKTANYLGITRRTLLNKMKKYDIKAIGNAIKN